jgi:hypothetical protein
MKRGLLLDEDNPEKKRPKTSEKNSEGHLKCTSCNQYLPLDQFRIKKNGTHNKTCSSCLDKMRCQHNIQRSKCKECKGGSICEHDKIRSLCKECKGGGICEHDRRRSRCKECKGGGICEHDKIRSECKECKGGGICEHDRRRSRCKECKGGSLCEHDRIRYSCKECKKSKMQLQGKQIINVDKPSNSGDSNNNLETFQNQKYENTEEVQKSHREILINEDSDETISETEIELMANKN